MLVSRSEIFGAASRAVLSSVSACGGGPDLGRHRAAFGAALLLALRVQHPEQRHHIAAPLFGACDQLPVVGVHPVRDRRRQLLGLQSGRQRIGELSAGLVGQQRVARRRDRETRGRRLGKHPAGCARIAQERLRQIAARGEHEQQRQQQAEAEQHYRASSAIMEIWCPIGPPPPRVRRRWLKNLASSAAVSMPSTLTEPMPAVARRAAQ